MERCMLCCSRVRGSLPTRLDFAYQRSRASTRPTACCSTRRFMPRSRHAPRVSDQVDGVRFLASRLYVDSTRVGIYGWSYGGYMTLRALLRASNVFKVGISGAPVTFWEGYDTHYTERYMSIPTTNEAGYRTSS